ncbi:uracil-DNA glycosylase [Kordiimonas aestuarii]|uniref:uracil-DNA glycosylase n=1 Tax=Kordiimonas aestuarii TaxID=1005925 RepID=UPI0021D1A5C3|nr:uracil-DNA glycosylase [Kordiimonas aestuarii]
MALSKTNITPPEPDRDCALCPRLVKFRQKNRKSYPDFFNGAVSSFGDLGARLMILGLAPGLQGANKTGRPFTGDFSGVLLFKCLEAMGWTDGINENRADDTLALHDVIITNAVRCVPPENRPTTHEVQNCKPYLLARFDALPNLKVIFALGKVAHDAAVRNFGLKLVDYKFAHGAVHPLPKGLTLVDSYHCSRYNVNTGRLTEDMFMQAMSIARQELAQH